MYRATAPAAIRDVVASSLQGRRLLDHPFYRRWEAGTLLEGELAAYAAQYRHIERALPGVLGDILARTSDGPARRLVEATLADEQGNPRAHVELFEEFAVAVGAGHDETPAPATVSLIELQIRSGRSDARTGLATIAAYEVQAAEVAASKADGLRRHYGVGPAGTTFWDVHAAMEAEHADWSMTALAAQVDDPSDVAGPVGEAARAWWALLDERESLAGAVAG
jgi:pyrroloquinoline-quinone synthase